MIKVRTDFHKANFKKIAVFADRILKIEGAAIIDVDFTDEEGIRELNARTRNIDKVTDVLSYPYLNETDKPFTEENYPEDYDFKSRCVELGCIAICREYIEKAAREDETVYISDVYRAFTHGILHLMGYDHMTEEDYDKMHAKENEILLAAGLIK